MNTENSVSIRNVTKLFSGKTVLDSVSLEIPSGGVLALLGRNGAGKTTLMRILFGLIEPDSGKTEVHGFDSQSATVPMRLNTGFMSEECQYYPWMTGKQLINFLSPLFPTWDGTFLDNLIKTLEVPLDQQVKTLSKGAKRKLQLALTLAPKPRVILLDEPLAGLDAVIREQILTTIVSILSEQGCTILLSSHELFEVERICDRVVILSRGKFLIDLDKNGLKSGMRRVIVDLENPFHTEVEVGRLCQDGTVFKDPIEVLPSNPGIIHAKCRGSQIEIIVRDFSEEKIKEILIDFKTKSYKVENLSLSEIFIILTSEKEESG